MRTELLHGARVFIRQYKFPNQRDVLKTANLVFVRALSGIQIKSFFVKVISIMLLNT